MLCDCCAHVDLNVVLICSFVLAVCFCACVGRAVCAVRSHVFWFECCAHLCVLCASSLVRIFV